MQIKIVPIDSKENNIIIGTAHFIKTISDLEKILSVENNKFGVAFCEASGPRLIRSAGSDPKLIQLAIDNAKKIGAGHSFIIVLGNTFPIQFLNQIKALETVCTIHCATANPLKVLVVEEDDQRGIVGVLDGQTPLGVEGDQDIADRKALLTKLGY
jgi:uncharacterized protein